MKYAYIGTQCVPYLDLGPENGSGLPLLFLHGWGVSPWVYSGMLDILARDMRVVAPFMPVLTWNRATTPFKSHRDWADLVASFCAQIGIDKAHVAGQSTGGGIAACLASRHPDLAMTLTLIDPSGGPGKHVRNVPLAALGFALLLLDLRFVTTQAQLAASFLTNLALSHVHLVLAARIPLMEDLTAEFESLDRPTQLLWGTLDVLFSPATAQNLRRLISGSELHLVRFGPHQWELSRPQLAADLILAFIRKTPSHSPAKVEDGFV